MATANTPHKKTRRLSGGNPRVALCAAAIASLGDGAASEVQLLPSGEFLPWDGRPLDVPTWRINAALAAKVIAFWDGRKTPGVIDYEHQTLRAVDNGKPAPAAGWFSKLEWREGAGLFALGVQWTDAASAAIASGEYKFISPVIAYDEHGNITAVLMASLVNYPAIDGMGEVMVSALSALFPDAPNPTEESMDELLERLRYLLNLPTASTAADISAELQKLQDLIGAPDKTAAASFDLLAAIGQQKTQLATLSAQTPDPAKYVPVTVLAGVQGELAALSAELTALREKDAHAVLSAELKRGEELGKISPAIRDWATNLGKKDLASLSAYIDQAAPMVPIGTQTGGLSPTGVTTAALSADVLKVCASMGVSPEDYAKTLAAEAAA